MANQGYSKRTISVEHVTIRSNNSFDFVRAKLAGLVPRIDDGRGGYGFASYRSNHDLRRFLPRTGVDDCCAATCF